MSHTDSYVQDIANTMREARRWDLFSDCAHSCTATFITLNTKNGPLKSSAGCGRKQVQIGIDVLPPLNLEEKRRYKSHVTSLYFP